MWYHTRVIHIDIAFPVPLRFIVWWNDTAWNNNKKQQLTCVSISRYLNLIEHDKEKTLYNENAYLNIL